MGLLSHISTSALAEKKVPFEQEKNSSKGLLARAKSLPQKSFSSIYDFAKENHFEHCGLFTEVHGMMVITDAFGLDSFTIANSVSSKDFWVGSLKSSDVFNYSKSDNEFYNFLQFFSFELKNLIKHISFLKIQNKNGFSVLMVFNTDDSEIKLNSSLIEFINLDNSYESNLSFGELTEKIYFLYSINYFELAFNSIINIQLPEENIKNAVIQCLDKEIENLLKNAFPKPAIVSKAQNGKIKIALPTCISDELLIQSHINLLLTKILSNSSTKPDLNFCGKAFDKDSLYNFLEN